MQASAGRNAVKPHLEEQLFGEPLRCGNNKVVQQKYKSDIKAISDCVYL